MRKSAKVVLLISVIALSLYWTPVPIVLDLGSSTVVLGGYPWINPGDAETTPDYDPQAYRSFMMLIGLAISAFFIAADLVIIYLSKRMEEEALGEAAEEEIFPAEAEKGAEEERDEIEW